MIPGSIRSTAPAGVSHNIPFCGQWHYLVMTGGGVWYKRESGDGGLGNGVEWHWRALPVKEAQDWAALADDYEDNRIKYFLPHGEGLAFLNDWENGIVLLTAPTRVGKSCHGTAFGMMRTIQMSEDWHCVKRHGVKYHEWRGPRKLVVSSYSWANVAEVWGEYQKWCPRSVLGPYALDWGKREGERHPKTISFTGNSTKVVKLTDGSQILFLCDSQKQGAWEGKRWDDHHCDEQRMREKFIGYLRGTANTSGGVQCCMTLTGHILPERPDTGAAGWIYRDLVCGRYTYGKTVGQYKISIDDVPEAVLSAERKKELYEQWVEGPERNKDEEMIRKGKARYFGGWESGSGMVIDNFSPETHVIPNYPREHHVVADATKYRGIDHGLGRPCAAAFVEVFPWGDMVVYDEYYEPGRTVPYHARKIVEKSGNRIEKVMAASEMDFDADAGDSWDTWAEVEDGTEFHSSVMDSRSFSSPAQERPCTLGQLYNDYGLTCTKASGAKNENSGGGQVEKLRGYLAVQKDRDHIMVQFYRRGIISEEMYNEWLAARGGDTKNGARLYICARCRFLIQETLEWRYNPKTHKPEAVNDHLIGGALKYVMSENPVYFGQLWNVEDE